MKVTLAYWYSSLDKEGVYQIECEPLDIMSLWMWYYLHKYMPKHHVRHKYKTYPYLLGDWVKDFGKGNKILKVYNISDAQQGAEWISKRIKSHIKKNKMSYK